MSIICSTILPKAWWILKILLFSGWRREDEDEAAVASVALKAYQAVHEQSLSPLTIAGLGGVEYLAGILINN